MADIYSRVADLESAMTVVQQALTGKADTVADSGWLNITPLNGALAYNELQRPQYRKIGNRVFLRGVFKNIVEFPKTVAQLPEGYRPSKRIIFNGITNGNLTVRYELETNGNLSIVHNGNLTFNETYHYSLESLVYLVD